MTAATESATATPPRVTAADCGSPCTTTSSRTSSSARRVRFGHLHLYDNRYVVPADAHGYRYSLGLSTESAVYAESNAFTTPGHVEAADLVKSRNGTTRHQTGTLFNGCPVALLAIHNTYNSGSERDLTADVGRAPNLHQKIDSAGRADREVARGAGAGSIR